MCGNDLGDLIRRVVVRLALRPGVRRSPDVARPGRFGSSNIVRYVIEHHGVAAELLRSHQQGKAERTGAPGRCGASVQAAHRFFDIVRAGPGCAGMAIRCGGAWATGRPVDRLEDGYVEERCDG